MKKNKKIFAIILSVSMMFLLVACGSSSSSTKGNPSQPSKDKPAELRLSFWFGAEDLKYWQVGIDEFTKENPTAKIIVESTPWADYWTKFKTQVASDSQADIFGMVSMYSDFYIENKAILDLGPYIKKKKFPIDDYWPGMMKAYSKGESVYCLPYDLSTNLMLCNLDVFKAAGVEFKPNYTMDEFLEVCKKISAEKNSNGSPKVIATDWYPKDWTLYDVLLAAGVNPLDANGKLAMDTPEVTGVVQWLADLYLKYKVGGVPNPQSQDLGYFESGTLAMRPVNPEWVMRYKERMPKANLDVTNLPFADKKGIRVTEGGSFAISSKTKYPDLSWKFVQKITSAQTLERIVGKTHRGIPGRISVKDSMLTSPNAVKHSSMFFDVMQGSTWVNYKNRTETEVALSPFMDKIYLGELTAKEGLAQFQKEANTIMNK